MLHTFRTQAWGGVILKHCARASDHRNSYSPLSPTPSDRKDINSRRDGWKVRARRAWGCWESDGQQLEPRSLLICDEIVARLRWLIGCRRQLNPAQHIQHRLVEMNSIDVSACLTWWSRRNKLDICSENRADRSDFWCTTPESEEESHGKRTS